MKFLGSGKTWFNSPARVLLLALTLVPLTVLIVDVIRYKVDVPFWDQWNFVPLLGKSFEGGISFGDLWALHNEHRLFFPRLIMLGLAHLSGYNISYELALNILLAAAIFFLVLRRAKKVFSLLGSPGFPWVAPILSLLAFSLHQGENWVWGWQVQIFLNVLAVVAGFMILASPEFKWINLFGGGVCGVVAAYSYANGLAYWLLGFFCLLLVSYSSTRTKLKALAAWLGLTTVIFISYFFRFHPASPSGEPLSYFAMHLWEYIKYILKYLGAPIITYQAYALFFGILCLSLFGLTVRAFARKYGIAFAAMLPFLLLSLYAVASAALTGIGRVGFGTAQATSYRYVTFANLIWFSNFVFLSLQLREIRARSRLKVEAGVKTAAFWVVLFIFVFLIGRTSYRVGSRVLRSYHDRLLPARSELLRGGNDELLGRLYINPDYVREGTIILKRHALSVFRKANRQR
jgi:hypothetical protein